MTDEAASVPTSASGFSARTILVLVLVGIVAFAGLSVLAVYAPEFRGLNDGGAHALSPSAVGYRGAVIMLKALKTPVLVSREPPKGHDVAAGDLLVLTPREGTQGTELQAFPYAKRILIVIPKWFAFPDPQRPPFVRKSDVEEMNGWVQNLLKPFGAATGVIHRKGVSTPVLRGAPGGAFEGASFALGRIDRLQTLRADGWVPDLVDETGAVVLAHAKAHPGVFVLAEPDLLNNQGLAQLANARAGIGVLQRLNGNGVVFDVTLNGFARGRSIGRLMLEPPWLAATLCALAAALLMGLHALARFGPAREAERAFALGAGALVDNSAGLVRMARKEAALLPAYVGVCQARVVRAAGGPLMASESGAETWLTALAERRGLETPQALAAEAARAKTRDEALALGRKLYRWTREMTREGG